METCGGRNGGSGGNHIPHAACERTGLSCELCNVHPSSRETRTCRLTFVVGRTCSWFKADVPSTEDELRKVMGQFGGVVSVVVVATDSDVYALVEFGTVESALSALRHPSPLTLHAHTLTVKPRLLKTNKIPKRTVMQGRRKRLSVSMAMGEGASVEVREGGKEEVVGGIRLTSEAVAALSDAHSVDQQMETLASHCRLGNSTAEDQLSLAWQLQAKFCPFLPSCVVIPFGAPFSGHGTLSSDCDLCLLSRPSPLDLSLFLGPAYLPSHLHSFWESLQVTRPMPLCPPPLSPQRSGDPGFEEVLHLLQINQSLSGVWALHSARVPIIRFSSGQLHCDLSINNRLGPANTRLLAAYMNFDPRMAILVPCVRLWVRGWGLGRSQLNSYAVSQLLIHCLQHTSPPVLPCLQEPGVWPRDMAWIGSRGLSVEQPVQFDGWNCSFTDPLSLLPSKNTASAAQLLLHFFKYFSEVFSFSEHIVAIHTLSPPHISDAESPAFRVSVLCVQDPFDRSHNVTKSMGRGPLARLLQALRRSRQFLAQLLCQEHSDPSTRQNMLLLFRPLVDKSLPDSQNSAAHSVQLDMQTLSRLLHNTPYEALGGRLEELSLNNALVHQSLDHVVLHSLAHHFQNEFGVRVRFKMLQEMVQTPTGPPPQTEAGAGTLSAGVRKRGWEEEEEMEVEEGGGFKTKRQRLEGPESAEQLLFRLTKRGGLDCLAECVAEEESWIGGRHRRRQKMSSAVPLSPSPPATPCLSFFLSVTSQHLTRSHTATVVLQATQPKFKLPFELFFSVCKKKLFS